MRRDFCYFKRVIGAADQLIVENKRLGKDKYMPVFHDNYSFIDNLKIALNNRYTPYNIVCFVKECDKYSESLGSAKDGNFKYSVLEKARSYVDSIAQSLPNISNTEKPTMIKKLIADEFLKLRYSDFALKIFFEKMDRFFRYIDERGNIEDLEENILAYCMISILKTCLYKKEKK